MENVFLKLNAMQLTDILITVNRIIREECMNDAELIRNE